MLVSNTLIAVVAEFNLALLIVAGMFFFHSRKLKSLVRRQQEKMLAILKDQKNASAPPASTIITYKSLLARELQSTSNQFEILAPERQISDEPSAEATLLQRVLALRYAFLRAEELGATEPPGSAEHWNIFEQALAPLLPNMIAPSSASEVAAENPALAAELETALKRIENLEKFKRLFFDMEKQWNAAKSNAQDYYSQLMALSEGVNDRDGFNDVLQRYHGVYDDIYQNVMKVAQHQNPDLIHSEQKTIHITRRDPRAAEEIVKLRNVAADQHRIINQLQRKLMDAKTTEEKESVIHELQQQLQRQTRFVQESETCVRLLEDELSKVHDQLTQKDRALGQSTLVSEENERIKNTLHNFTLESMSMVANLESLEKENDSLKQTKQKEAPVANAANSDEAFKKVQSEYMDLKKQYAELEERYLDLKLGN